MKKILRLLFSKKIKKSSAVIPFLVIFLILIFFNLIGCTNSEQAFVTVPTAIDTSPVETTLIELPQTSQIEEEKTASNFELLYVPKIMPTTELGNIPWFSTIKNGLEKCAQDYGFKVTVIGPPKFNSAMQAQIILDNIGKNFDAIIVSPIEEEIIDSAFERAGKAGILTFSNEGYNLKNIIFDIEAMSNIDFGNAIMKKGIDYAGGQGKYLVSVGFLTSYIQNQWADAEIQYQKEKASSMINILGTQKGQDRFEDNEDQKVAVEKLTSFFDNNKDLKLVVGNSAITSISAGEVISKKKLKGKVSYVGVGLPIALNKYILNGVLQEGFFWDPYNLGYSMGYIAFKSWMANGSKDNLDFDSINSINNSIGGSVKNPSGNKIDGYEELQIIKNEKGASVIFGSAIESVNIKNLEEWNNKFAEYGWPKP